MALITTDIPNLIGGVSQQPASMRILNQCEAQENAVPSTVEGLKKRPPTKHVKNLISSVADDAFIHHINRDSTEQYIVVIDGGGSVKVFDLDGTTKTVTPDAEGSSGSTIAAYFTTTAGQKPKDVFKAVTIADVTFFVNSTKTVAQASTLSTHSGAVAGSSAAPKEALIVVKRSPSNYSQCNIEIQVDGEDVGLTSDTHGSTDFGYGTSPGESHGLDAIETAARIKAALASFSPSSSTKVLTTVEVGSSLTDKTVVRVSCTDGGAPADFNLTVSDGQGNQIVEVIKDKVNNFADLPSTAPHRMLIEVSGNPDTDIDDYYVRFIGDGSPLTNQITRGRWIEDTAGGIKNEYDYTTLPHILVRNRNPLVVGDFLLNAADGSYGGSTAAPMGNFKFSPRLVGDETTNPPPTFVDHTINDITFFKNRLVLLSEENVIMSEVGEYFNFYRNTVAQLVDSSVIDIAVGGTTVNNLNHAVPFSDRLILFSDTAQFSLQSDTILSPLTASITPQTKFETTDIGKPVVSGDSLFFAFPRGEFSGVKQFFKVNEVDIQFDAVEITAQVPKYLKGTIKDFAAATHENIVLAVTETDSSTLYAYNYFRAGGERLQSSWSKFTFGGSIYSLFFRDTTLYLLIKYGNDLFLEKMEMETGLVDTGVEYVATLDRRVSKTSGTYSANTDTTEWNNLGYTPSSSAQVVTAAGQLLETTAQGAGTITVKGDFSSQSVFIGEPYTMRYELSHPLIKDQDRFGNQVPIFSSPQNRMQLRYLNILFDNTAYFKVKVTPQYGTESSYVYTGRFYGDGSSVIGTIPLSDGDFRVPVFSQPEAVKIELINDSALPSNFQALQFETEFTTRSQQRR